jgi:hypothetical protein
MFFKVTFSLSAARVEMWICKVKQQFLIAAPIKCVGLDYEYIAGCSEAACFFDNGRFIT